MPAAPISRDEVQRLAAVSKANLMGTPAEERFDRITRLARRVFDVPFACIDIVGEKLLWLKSVQGFDGVDSMRCNSYCHWTILSKDIMVVSDARLDPRVHDSALANTWVYYAGIPLRFDGFPIGALCIGDSTPRDFDENKLSTLYDLADMAERELDIAALSESQIILARTNDELEMKSRVDVLTHVWNRGAIMELLEKEASRASTDHVSAALFIDVDHFKAINDNHGHQIGDHVLRVVSERLRAGVRPFDAVGRFGGEEFLVILPDVQSDNDVLRLAERLRHTIAESPISHDSTTIPVTCSIGCAVMRGSETLEDIVARADSAMYRAKQAGRNRVELA